MGKLQTCQITMQKLILLGLFLSCFEIQNILGHEHPDWDGFIKKLPLGTWRPLPNPPVTSEGPIVEPPPAPPIQDCWDGNKCQKNSHCGKNGNCRDLKIDHLGTQPVGVCDCKKPDCKEMALCTIPYGGQDDSCGVNGSCAPLKFCKKVFIAGIGIGSELEKAKGMGMIGRSRNQDIKPKPN